MSFLGGFLPFISQDSHSVTGADEEEREEEEEELGELVLEDRVVMTIYK